MLSTASSHVIHGTLHGARSIHGKLTEALASGSPRAPGTGEDPQAGQCRRVNAAHGRAHVEARSFRRTGTEDAARSLERRLEALEGVGRAEVNGVLGRVFVAYDEDRLTTADLLTVVDESEPERDAPPGGDQVGRDHPGDPEALARETVHAACDLLGMAAATLGSISRVAPLPPAVPALVSLAESAPQVRREMEQRLGTATTDTAFALGGAASRTLAARPLGLAIDAVHRFSLLTEQRARGLCWQDWDAELGAREAAHRVDPVHAPARPGPLPDGPVESYARRAAPLALAVCGGVLATARSSPRALAMLVAATPRAGGLARDAFGAQLGRVAAERGTLVLDRAALRRLDRVDTIVLDSATLLTGARTITGIQPLATDVERAHIEVRAHELSERPGVGRPGGAEGWELVPLTELEVPESAEVREMTELPASPGGELLVLRRERQPVALVTARPELDPVAEEIVAAASRAGAVAVTDDGGADLLTTAAIVAGGSSLPSSVRELQQGGHGVALVSDRNDGALVAADVGLGVTGASAPVPWGADVLCTPGLSGAHLMLEAMPAARQVSRRGSQLDLVGTAAGAFMALLGRAPGAPRRSSVAAHATALTALAAGTWAGTMLRHRPPPVPVDRTPWHAMPADAVLTRLGSRPGGLDDAEAERRPTGERSEEPSKGLLRASVEELANPLTPALAVGAGVSAGVGSLIDAALIWGVVVTNAFIGGAQRLGADRALRRLRVAGEVPVRVRRDGTEEDVTARELVRGDVIRLSAGDAVPADCRVLTADGLEVDESSLTGESDLVTKSARPTGTATVAGRHSMLYEGTTVAAGRGRAVVVATGTSTEIGRTTRVGGRAPRTTGVEARLRSLTRTTLPVSLGGGVLLLGAQLLRGRLPGQALGSAVGLAVAAVPEGLPFVSTVAQLSAARRLSARGALVRNPSTIEALGRVDVLCFDKTGTLTEGHISLRRASDIQADEAVEQLSPPTRRVVAAALRASPRAEADQPLPHPTDRAIVEGAARLGITPEDDLGAWKRGEEIPFEPSRGYHAVLGRGADGQRLSVKGAPEIVLARCATWWRDGEVAPFDEDARSQVDREFERLARLGYRVLAVAERAASDRRDLDEARIGRLHLQGLLCLADPVRPAAAAAAWHLHRAGTKVVMVTGDHPSTAKATAAELELLNGGRVMTGAELDTLNDGQLAGQLSTVSVFARVSPEQKARIVDGMQRAGRTVAVTGDGANDAPAIRLADVGMALGAGATPAAREAADVIVTDERIETVTDAIIEGRSMWSSVRDALAVLLGGNFGEIAFTVGSALVSGRDTLNARQLLLVNLLTDMLPAMAIAMRPPAGTTRESLLAEGPEASLGTALTRDIYVRAGTTAGAAGAAWLLGRAIGTPAHAATVALVALVAAQLGQTVAIGGRDPLALGSGAASLAVLGVVVQVPGLSHFFGCRPLGPLGWSISLGSATAATLFSAALPYLRSTVSGASRSRHLSATSS